MEQSDSIKELAAALVAAQGEFPAITKSKVAHVGHYSYQYADLADLVETVRPVLHKHGLAVVQTLGPVTVTGEGVMVHLTTELLHQSGEWIRSTSSLPAANTNPQAVGAVITYARRYAYQAVLGIAAEEDTDAQPAEPAQEKPTRVEPTRHATEAQRKKIWALARKLAWTEEDVKAYIREYYHTESTGDLTVSQASEFIQYLEAHGDEPPF